MKTVRFDSTLQWNSVAYPPEGPRQRQERHQKVGGLDSWITRQYEVDNGEKISWKRQN